MKKITFAILACTAMIGLSFSSCSSDDAIDVPQTEVESSSNEVTVLQVDGFSATRAAAMGTGVSSIDCDSLNAAMQATDTLTVDEIVYLLDLRDTKKLGIDLLAVAFDTNLSSQKLPRIREAHNTHKSAIERMLEFYGIEVPALTEAGVFEDTDLQARYDAAIAAMTNEQETIQTLMQVKEELIVALKADLTTVTNDNIKLLLENMLRAAQNHLCVFNNRLLEYDVTYVPTALTQEEFDAIIETGVQRGRAYSARARVGISNADKGGKMNKMNAKQVKEKRQEKREERQGNRQGKGQGKANDDGESSDDSTDGGTEE